MNHSSYTVNMDKAAALFVRSALLANNGNISEAALKIGISRSQIYKILKRDEALDRGDINNG